MDGPSFEDSVADLLRILGYAIDYRRHTSHGKEVDILASWRIPGIKEAVRLAVECKYRTKGGSIGNDLVIAFLNHFQTLRLSGVADRGLFISNMQLSDTALQALEQDPSGTCEAATPDDLLRRVLPLDEYVDAVKARCHDILSTVGHCRRPEASAAWDALDPGLFVWPVHYHIGREQREGNLHAWLAQWLASPIQRRLLILGQPGSGKTWLALTLALHSLHAYCRDGSAPIPFFVPARGWRFGEPLHLHVADHIQRCYGLSIRAPNAFKRFIESRFCMVILDGLDELQAEMDSADRKQLWAPLHDASRENKLVVTCRSAQASNPIVDRTLTGIGTDPRHDAVITLGEFGVENVHCSLEKLHPAEYPVLQQVLTNRPVLLEMCKRPAHMALVFDLLEAQKESVSDLRDLSALYEDHARRVIARDLPKMHTRDADLVYEAHCALAWMMHVEGTSRVRRIRLREGLLEHSILAKGNAESAVDALLSSSFVETGHAGFVSFVHMLIFEYFRAVRIVARLRAKQLEYGDLDERIDSDVLSSFLKSILTDRDRYHLSEFLAHEEHPWHQYFAAYYLSRLGAEEYADQLRQRYEACQDARVKREFAIALANLGVMDPFKQYFGEVLIEGSDAEDDNNRWIEHFFGNNREEAVAACAARLSHTDRYPARAMLIHYLGQWGRSCHRRLVKSFDADPDPFVCAVAARALDRLDRRVELTCVTDGSWSTIYPCLLVDFDGVLVDTLDRHVTAWNSALSCLDVTITRDTIALSEGEDPRVILGRLVEGPRLNDAGVTMDDILEHKNTEFRQQGPVDFTDAGKSFMDTVYALGMRAAIVTASPKDIVAETLRRARLPRETDVVSSADLPSAKPDAAPYLEAANKLGARRGDCVVIENSPAGVAAARAAGMTCIALTTTLPPSSLIDATDVAGGLGDALDLIITASGQNRSYPDVARLSQAAIDFAQRVLKLSYEQFDFPCRFVDAVCTGLRTFRDSGDSRQLDSTLWAVRDDVFRALYARYQEQARPAWIVQTAGDWLQGPTVVDVGCGTNQLNAYLLGGNHVGVECALGTDIDMVRAVTSTAEFRQHNHTEPYRIPCDDRYADTVVMANMLHHVPVFSQVCMLRECFRILREGGRCILIEDGYSVSRELAHDWDGLDGIFAGLDELKKKEVLALIDWIGTYFGAGAIRMPRPFSFRTLEQWELVFEFAGLKPAAATFLGFPTGKLHLNPQLLLVGERVG